MGKTDNTAPYEIQAAQRQDGAYGGQKPVWSRWLRRHRNRVMRLKVRATLRKGGEPAPEQHRHSALWDGW